MPTDLFTSKNFYKDQANWGNKLYYRCNTPRELSEMWNQRRIGANPPASASWGDCNADLTRESILSPYPYKTAKEHYAALMAAAKAKGGPTVYTKATTPDWDGERMDYAVALEVLYPRGTRMSSTNFDAGSTLVTSK